MMDTEFAYRLGVIGCGNMGAALLEHAASRLLPLSLSVFDKDQDKMRALALKTGAQCSGSAAELSGRSDIVILAVKPQDMAALLQDIRDWLKKRLLISIAAGIPLVSFQGWLGAEVSVVRAMPNLNAVIGRSVTALSRNPHVSPGQMACAQRLLESVGRVILVEESLMDAVTAISGSGPAFVAYLLDELSPAVLEETMMKQALIFGFSPDNAEILVEGTIQGTQEILAGRFDTASLIRRVSSKAGTTEAGMNVLREEGKNPQALMKALMAAHARARELSLRYGSES